MKNNLKELSFKRGDKIKVKCVDFTFDGQGLAKYLNRVIFVPSLLIDEEAEVEILYRKKDYDIGKITKLITFSPYRINPLCKCATSCGGCSFQNLDYQKELEIKKNLAINTLKTIGKVNFKSLNPKIIGMDEPTYYRNKIQIPFGYDKQHRLVYGLYKYKSHDIVPIKECVISSKEHVSILSSIKNLMLDMKIKAYDEDLEKGVLRHVLIRVGKASKEIMVVLIVNEVNFKNKKNFVNELVKLHPEITTVIYNYNLRKTNVILGEKEEVAYGKGYIYDYLLGVKFKISSKSFYQVNHDQCEKLYSLAIQKAMLTKEDDVLDLYCGIGTIGLIAAKYAKKVQGIEIVKEAIIDAKENAKLNNIENISFMVGDAKEVLLKKAYDVIFLDPPRKGLDLSLIKQIMNSHPKRIVYVSCDVGTLARDLTYLTKNYNIDSIDFVDMFPRTFHVETVASLSEANTKKIFR